MAGAVPARTTITVIRYLAAAVAWLYPPSFRLNHGREFPDVAAHWYVNELRRSGHPLRAMAMLGRVMARDTVFGVPAAWRHAARGEASLAARSAPFWTSPLRVLGQMGRDLRQAGRMARRQPALTVLVVVTLGLGIGVSAASYAALDRVVLRPMAFPQGGQIVYLMVRSVERGWISTPELPVIEQARSSGAFAGVGGYQPTSATYIGGAAPEVVSAANVTPDLAALLQVRPVAGRVLGPTDTTGDTAPVVMISESFWRRQLGGVADVVDRPLTVGTTIYRIAGVWPQSARIDPWEQPDLFFVRKDVDLFEASTLTYGIGRLHTGVARAVAESDLVTRLGGHEGLREGFQPALIAPTVMLSDAYIRGLWLVFGASLLFAVVSVANAANMLLARSSARVREFNIRLALGSSVSRLASQFFIEGLLFSGSGAVLAVAIAWASSRLLAAVAGGKIPPAHFDGVLGVAMVGAAVGGLLAALLCGLVPLLEVSRQKRAVTFVNSGSAHVVGRSSRLRQGLLAVQAGIGVVLVSGAVLMARSVDHLTSVDVGFAAQELLTFSLSTPTSRYPTREAKSVFLRRVRDEVAALPGVRGVTSTGQPLFRLTIQEGQPYLDGQVPSPVSGETLSGGAVEGFFDVLGIPLKQGRLFEPGDDRVVIVNETFARTHGGEVVGRRLYIPRRGVRHEELVPREIVGVVGDVVGSRLSTNDGQVAQIWGPTRESLDGYVRFIVRTTVDPSSVMSTIRARIAELDPMLPLLSASTGRELLRAESAEHRFVALLLAGLASVGLVLAVAGIYGSIVLEVRRRVREVGLRMALGANARGIVSLIARRGMRPVAVGAIIGLLAWQWMASMLSTLLFQVEASDIPSMSVAVLLVLAVALVACVWPARRASTIDPSIALRVE